MNVSVRANCRVAEAARGGIPPALNAAFRGGAITGMLVVGLALLGVAGYYGALTFLFDKTQKEAVDALIGLGFGGSLISVFARLGGGIFTKGADVGADLVGKVEAGIPEDDPRNPAVIADNVGDNVGDCAGMAADLFETYAVTAVAVMLLGVLTFAGHERDAGRAVPARARRRGDRRLDHRHVRRQVGGRQRRARALPGPRRLGHHRRRRLLSGHEVDDGRPADGDRRRQRLGPSVGDLYLCSLIGLGVTALLFLITDYYTSTRFNPVKKTAEASQTGHATNIISGLSQGMQATALPAIVLALGIYGANELGGIYGIGVAVMAQLGLCGLIVALDAFGPITDNAGGIAEMAEMPEEVRNVTDPLDAVGNTTKAVTKGYAIGSAVLAALVLFAAFKIELEAELAKDGKDPVVFLIDKPLVLIGLLIGGMMVYLFAALSMEAVGRAGGAVVEEVRRQFKEKPGIMDGTREARLRDLRGHRHEDRAARDDHPVADPDRLHADRRPAERRDARRPAHRRDRRRPLHGRLDDRRRRRLGQRQEAHRGGRVRRQGHARARGLDHGRHGRRSLQGHLRPGDQPDDQGREHRRDPHHPAGCVVARRLAGADYSPRS